jgi:hypothetical protein
MKFPRMKPVSNWKTVPPAASLIADRFRLPCRFHARTLSALRLRIT